MMRTVRRVPEFGGDHSTVHPCRAGVVGNDKENLSPRARGGHSQLGFSSPFTYGQSPNLRNLVPSKMQGGNSPHTPTKSPHAPLPRFHLRPVPCTTPRSPRCARLILDKQRPPVPPKEEPELLEPILPPSLKEGFESHDVTLGIGAFAKIYKISKKDTGEEFALKIMERELFSSRGIEYLIMNEIDALRRCVESRRVVKLFDAREEDGQVFLRMELCHTNLLCHVNGLPHHHASERSASVWAVQLFFGLAEIHHAGILHRDIKPENLLLATDGSLKIADFGWSAHISDDCSSLAGTFQFMAPEVLNEEVHTVAVDVWSAGATIYQVLMGNAFLMDPTQEETGFSADDPHEATKVRTSRLLDEIDEKCPLQNGSSSISPECWDFLRQTLTVNVDARVKVSEALRHAWINDLEEGHLEDPKEGFGNSFQSISDSSTRMPDGSMTQSGVDILRGAEKDVSSPTDSRERLGSARLRVRARTEGEPPMRERLGSARMCAMWNPRLARAESRERSRPVVRRFSPATHEPTSPANPHRVRIASPSPSPEHSPCTVSPRRREREREVASATIPARAFSTPPQAPLRVPTMSRIDVDDRETVVFPRFGQEFARPRDRVGSALVVPRVFSSLGSCSLSASKRVPQKVPLPRPGYPVSHSVRAPVRQN